MRAVLNAKPLISPITRRLFHIGQAFFRSMGTRAMTQRNEVPVASSWERKVLVRSEVMNLSPSVLPILTFLYQANTSHPRARRHPKKQRGVVALVARAARSGIP